MQSPNLPGFIVGVLILALSFSLLERLFPSLLAPRKGTFRPGAFTDLGYLFFNAFITKQLIRFFNLVLLGLGMLLVSGSFDRSLLDGHGILMQQPPYLLLVEMILLADFITYWMHRLLHSKQLWRIHAIHHSSRELDWLSSARLHPLNQLLTSLVVPLTFLFLGFPLKLAVVYAPFLTLYGIFLHANVSFEFGVFKYIVSTPQFHRWHHSRSEEAIDKNFAGLFPVFDMLFGTFYLPEGKEADDFGVSSRDFPEGIGEQFVYPFIDKARG